MNDVQERVQRGAALLDEKLPGWRSKIDVDTLDIANPYNCIAGQLGGPYQDGYVTLRRLGLTYWHEGKEYGFEDRAENYSALTEAWKQELARAA